MIQAYMEIGLLVGAHGIRGECKVKPLCDGPSFLRGFGTLYWDAEGRGAVRVLGCREHGGLALLLLEGVPDRTAAETLRGRTLYLRRADASLAPGQYFIAELTGCAVFDAADPARRYGTLSGVSQTGANDVWHIAAPSGKEWLIPVIDEVVKDVDVAVGRILISPLPGLLDDERVFGFPFLDSQN
ncbi:MAG: ribosome maturation factor RimM [Oscillospiraceae bacterium]|jgi:16S rRNA processing protein RimM|nr:ribosome maturation factor RimM [Oscillospiraceae bacterium]